MVSLSSLRRGSVVFIHDLVMAALSFVLSLYLRLGSEMLFWTDGWLAVGTLLFTGVCGAVFLTMNLYRGVWRYASLSDLMAITRSATLAVLVFTVVMFAWTRLEFVPRSLPFINWFVLMALLGAPRFLYRLLKDRRFEFSLDEVGERIPVLLAGAGDGAELFLRALRRPGAEYSVTGIVSESPGRVGRRIHGVSVLGTFDQLRQVVEKLDGRGRRPRKVILTKDDLEGPQVGALLETVDALGMTLARLPRLTDLKSGPRDKLEVRPVAVEDLLGRPQAALDREAMSTLIAGRRVLITGAGGSIGSELVRQVSDFAPASLVLVESSEYALYRIDLELARRHPRLVRHAVIANVRDRARIHEVFGQFAPELVFHAAALKHVPLVEANRTEGLLTNVMGTRNVADACVAQGVRAMVMISTDKAVNPSSVMGLAKRVAEIYCQALDIRHGAAGGPHFVTVRFGNVLGSTGSVVPLFRRQLEAGGPLTVTHPEMKRYFMTIREAVELVLEASALGARRHDEGKIFVLDMGEPVKILDLARQMIRLAGLKPDVDVRIEFTGVRPGEKLFEEIFHGAEDLVPTEYKGVLLAAPRLVDLDRLLPVLDDLEAACRAGDGGAALEIVRALVPEYAPPVI